MTVKKQQMTDKSGNSARFSRGILGWLKENSPDEFCEIMVLLRRLAVIDGVAGSARGKDTRQIIAKLDSRLACLNTKYLAALANKDGHCIEHI
jgi:hypothetical protein